MIQETGPSQTRELYSAAGWSLTVLAWMSTDLQHPRLAEEHLRAAWLCAENAEQNNLRAWVRATQHTAAFWQNDYRMAAQYAKDGLRYATEGTASLFPTSAWALDLARCGDHITSREALEQARREADQLGSMASSDELAGPFTCSADRAGGFWSDTHLELGDASRALSYADHAVSAFESKPIEVRNLGSERMVRCQAVKAHLQLSELDGAAEALGPVLETSPEHRVDPLVRRVKEIMALAGAHAEVNKAPLSREIRDAAGEFQLHQPKPLDSFGQIEGGG